MPVDTDLLVDRRRIRRKLTFWRLAAFALAAVAVIGLGLAFGGRALIEAQRTHIARITISGLITGDTETLKLLESAAKADSVAGVVLAINSPGGTVSGSEALHEAIRKLVATKPTVATVDSAAASGGYIAAIATDHIVSRGSSIVGSIGVIAQYPNFTKLLDTVGVQVEAVRSSPLKAEPDGLGPTPPEARAALEATVLDSYAWFKQLVRERRHLNDAELAAISDGRVFTGRQGVPLKLVDEIGGEDKAIAWLVKTKNVPENLPIRDLKRPERGYLRLPFSAAAELARVAGLGALSDMLARPARALDVSTLDGLLALWQPAP
jgi:protease-4